MNRKVNLTLLLTIFLLLTACQSSQQMEPKTEKNIDFDRNTAIEMVKKKEKIVIDIASKEKVTKVEYEALEKSLAKEFGDHTSDILSIFFIEDLDADPDADRYANRNTLYPTLFHEGVTVTSAAVYKAEYEQEAFNQTELRIKEEYVGDDEKLKDWDREYLFKPDENEEWEFTGFSGTLNVSGEDYNMNYLELKR
ncbi:hypothetical protein [Paenibacillus tundrae]|uniref:hypothetical protein n=1 Tax=Paenibacillus tundrae TaxID=528187 RepID=UPI0030D02C12